jgi:hypothetical protein
LPYLLVYGAGLALDREKGEVRTAFLVLHVVVAAILVVLAAGQVRKAESPSRWFSRVEVWFWLLLALVFLLPGAFLEFPGDPWEHVRRLNLPRADEPLRTGGVFVLRLAYFWGWSILSLVEPLRQRAALGVLSAFWQLLVAIQFYRFARRLGFSPAWARVQVVGVVAFFGTNVFSFFRYYALSTTPAAYVAYLGAAVAILDLLQVPSRRRRAALELLACLGLMFFNHIQELLLTGAFAAAAIAWHWRGRALQAASRTLDRSMVLGWALSILGGLLVTRSAAQIGLHGANVSALWPWLSRFGVFRIWDARLNFWPAIGIVGILAMGLALWKLKENSFLAVLTLAPIASLLFPPFCLAFVEASHPANAYRMLYAVPWTFMIVAVAQEALDRGSEFVRQKGPLAAGLALSLAGCVSAAPLWGKVPFQLYVPPPSLNLAALDATAQWLSRNRPRAGDCVYKSDAVTEFVVASFRGSRTTVERVSGLHLIAERWVPWSFANSAELESYASGYKLCGFLVADPASVGSPASCPRSWIGADSGHWRPDAACLAHSQPAHLASDCESLLARGWTKTRVPPFYTYYEPPAPGRSSPLGVDSPVVP